MSWSESRTAINLDDIRAMRPVSQAAQAAPDQFDVVRDALAAVVHSGAVGDPERHLFNVSLSGHANPGHEPAEGYGVDCLYVSVSQAARDLPKAAA